MKKAIDLKGNVVEVDIDIPVRTRNGKHYLLSSLEETKMEDKKTLWDSLSPSRLIQEIREGRTSKLEEVDYLINKAQDTGNGQVGVLRTYRQALRDVTKQVDEGAKKLEDIVWPVKP